MIWRKSICLILCAAVLCSFASAQSVDGSIASEELAALLGTSPEKLMKSDSLIPGDATSDWTALILARNGWTQHREEYLNGLWKFVSESYRDKGGLDPINATVWHRVSLTVLALGADPTCFGENKDGTSIDLIADGTYGWSMTDSLGTQGTNAWIFALLVLDAMDYAVPEDAAYTRKTIIENILACQTDDGGFHIGSGASDVDVTAMALQALAPYYADDDSVAQAADRALAYLSGRQNAQGDFGNGGSESCAQVILALCALGIDPEGAQFTKSGGTALNGLLLYHTPQGFSHLLGGGANTLATQQAAQALTALDRMRNGEGRLYDFTDLSVRPFEPEPEFPVWIIPLTAAILITICIRKGKRSCTV